MKEKKKITLSREEEALAEIRKTQIGHRTAVTATAVFLCIVLCVPLIQMSVSIPRFGTPRAADTTAVERIMQYNASLIEQKDAWESAMEEQSFLRRFFPQAFQGVLALLHTGNEKAIMGRHGYLFYEQDIRYYQSPIDFRSVACIADFAEQLRSRGIALVVMPVPLKPGTLPYLLSPRYGQGQRLEHPDYARWKAMVEEQGVQVMEPGQPLNYLREDTHWDAESMENTARQLAGTVAGQCTTAGMQAYTAEAQTVTNRGDIYTMLDLSERHPWGEPQSITIHRVTNEYGEMFQPSRQAEVLVMGDSFANIFSLEGMGWGDSAGLTEQLACFLQAPVDAIRRNDAGSIATRRMLQTELKRGRDRLEGKRVVVWEFAERELAFGNWEKLDMTPGVPAVQTFITLGSGQTMHVQATIADRSASPAPDRVTYPDHVIALHLTNLTDDTGKPIEGEAVVYAIGMKDRKLTPTAYLRAGDRISLTLQCWQDREAEYGALNRNEPEDIELQLQEPLWGENITRTNL